MLVLRLCCAGTVEEVILRRAHAKLLATRGVSTQRLEPLLLAALASDSPHGSSAIVDRC